MGAPGNIGRSPANRGFVIVAVLWILLALSSLAIIFSAYLAASARALAASDMSLQTEALVSAGLELAAYQLTLTDEKTRPPHGAFHFGLDEASIAVTFTSEAARIDLNYASKEMLVGLFAVLGARRGRGFRIRRPDRRLAHPAHAGQRECGGCALQCARLFAAGRGCSPMSTSWRWSPASLRRWSIARCPSSRCSTARADVDPTIAAPEVVARDEPRVG